MSREYVATFKRTIEDTVRVIVPDDLEVKRDAGGNTYIVQPGKSHVWLSLELAAREGLVTVERLHN